MPSVAYVVTCIIAFLTDLTGTVGNYISLGISLLNNLPWSPFYPSKSNRPQANAPRVAIIGAGLNGIGAAAACLASGVEVVIFEASDQIGGVWSRVNETSSLQFPSLFYRFHPLVGFRTQFPKRDEILDEAKRIYRLYDLHKRTRFNIRVRKVTPSSNSTWDVDGETFDGVISAVGTCGPENIPVWEGLSSFAGTKVHSAKMDTLQIPLQIPKGGLKYVVIGSGASAVEFVDYILNKIGPDNEGMLGFGPEKIEVTVLARHDKWMMPREPVIAWLSSVLPVDFGYLYEGFLRRFWYGHELRGMTPKRPFYASTPCLNPRFLQLIRTGKIRYVRGHIEAFDTTGVNVSVEWDSRSMIGKDSLLPNQRRTVHLSSDVVCCATGFKHPELTFIDRKVWQGSNSNDEYKPPHLHLLMSSPSYPTLCFLNHTYVDGVATAAAFHTGMVTRTMLMYLLDTSTRPSTKEAADWISQRTAAISQKETSARHYGLFPTGNRHKSSGGYDRWKEEGLRFMTYGEFCFWLIASLATVNRWHWLPYILGWQSSKGSAAARDYVRPSSTVALKLLPTSEFLSPTDTVQADLKRRGISTILAA
ncbi:uncharacterized protein SPPG_06067 [Spizellomyces punctatus DAOM BR117]|uniref:FAD/NAD(P)-binding domain-containing protein n=1 Tax=Spizellomyces punctatus (strain DAOM BR117) TaxID=645134 RepID=A0A0L0HBV9_SPIPD|nr:uncharacterized protein SPPG_06067 [Spizellomyces punctatus DAOM BR117]KNC98359.1 hypothetical protein SPPG_06067 [Spizellomyces punctatus DAOM BR117]|eukprot:XP_016606399.1 hypothetical protein SPPG_06067 [Spizellomyces punctatus DAOM BR117]